LRILLDTHLLLWWLEDSPSLPAQAREAIANPENTVFVSAVSLWEIWLKHSLPLAASQTRQAALLPWRHRDPFDRMLIAQAQVERLVLLTADEALAAYGGCVRLAR
jgi:PIN domain nuclease of toxin-antitoxin system